jgi:hypothetical protein
MMRKDPHLRPTTEEILDLEFLQANMEQNAATTKEFWVGRESISTEATVVKKKSTIFHDTDGDSGFEEFSVKLTKYGNTTQ